MMQIWSIWDLDGCLADDGHRKHLVTGRHRDYSAYHALCDADPLRAPEASLLKAWKLASPFRRVAIFTGRPRTVFPETLAWIRKHGLGPYVDRVNMRPEDDTRPVEVLKREMFEKLTRGYANTRTVAFAVDDRTKIIELWTLLGVPSLQSTTLAGTVPYVE